MLVSVLLSWLLWTAGAFWHLEGSEITGPTSLNCGGSFQLLNAPDMGLRAAIEQGTWRTFLLESFDSDSLLWTMKFELFGSGVVFLVAVALIATRSVITQVTILLVVAGLSAWRNAIYLTFWAGLAIAWLQTLFRIEIPKRVGIPMTAVAVYLFGFIPNSASSQTFIDFYGWMPVKNPIYVHGCAAVLILAAVAFCPQISRHLDGRAGVLLGRYSFPVYLIHILVIMSLGMFIFVHFEPIIGFPTASAITVLVSLFGFTMAATALMFVEEWWVKVVGKIPDLMLGPKAKVDQLGRVRSPAATVGANIDAPVHIHVAIHNAIASASRLETDCRSAPS